MMTCVRTILLFGMGLLALGQDAFPNTHFLAASPKGEKLTAVTFQLSTAGMALTDKKTSRALLEIPYSNISSMSYEKAKRHRTGEGAALAVVSLGGGLILMATKTESHWLAIDYTEEAAKRTLVLQLHKDEAENALSALESRSAKKVEHLAPNDHKINVTADSKNIDEVLRFPNAQLISALKPAFEKYSCSITKEKADEIECKRPKTANSEIAGIGGERVIAKFQDKDSATRLRIETVKGGRSSFAKKNWSTPIYKDMLENLKSTSKS